MDGTFFSLRRTGCSVWYVKKKKREAHTKSRLERQNFSWLLCHTYEVSWRARNERLSPRLLSAKTLRPVFWNRFQNFGSPAPFHNETTSVINFSTIGNIPPKNKNFKVSENFFFAPLFWRKQLIYKQINHHAGYGNIQPNRVCKAHNSFMICKLFRNRIKHCSKH